MVKTARNLTVLGIGLSVSAVVGWLLLKENKRTKDLAQVTIKSQTRADADNLPQIMIPMGSLENQDDGEQTREQQARDTDDLTLISDIGPRFAQALAAIGITRFEQLARQNPEALAEQMAPYVSVRSQRIRTRNWIEQAAQLAQKQ